jgi:superfamily II DNA or RNA helicase
MIGLYLLITNVLEKLRTIKFGMSMRLEYRWIDYLQIFNDAKYVYYYEFIDILTREQVLLIESEIIQLHISERNPDFQTEYFFVDDYNQFNLTIINILTKHKINYHVHDKHEFVRSYYDSKPESFEPNIKLDLSKQILSIDRYGQEEAYEAFKQIIKLDYYWGLMIAPTGWGKSMMHLLFMCYYLDNNPTQNCILITKKKDLLTDINNDIESDINLLFESKLVKSKPNILYCVNHSYNSAEINNLDRQSIIIINIDKLISKQYLDDPFAKIRLINWEKIGLLIFDEVHHIGSKCVYELINYLKHDVKLRYCIGSSATPIRDNFSNQNNIRLLFDKSNFSSQTKLKELSKEDLNILYEITYKEAWDAKIILKIKIDLIIVNQQLTIIDESKDKILGFSYTNDGRRLILDKIIDVLSKSFKHKIIFYTANRLSCLEWFEYISYDARFESYRKHISFSRTNSIVDEENKNEDKSLDAKVIYKINRLNISNQEIDTGIINFKSDSSYSMLFVVAKATEGFNDKLLDIVFNLDPIIDRSIVLELQKIGRTTRIIDDKQVGLYISPIIKTENYIDDMTNFMTDFIKTICKPINDKTSSIQPQSIIEYDNIYKQIFNVDGLLEIESKTIYDLVLKKSSPELTYSNCIKIIHNSPYKPSTKKEYYNLCQIDTRLSNEPDICFGTKFDWIEYLSIDRKLYYELTECKLKIQQFLKLNPIFNNKLPSTIINELCKLDNSFPPNDLFVEYYKVPISELIRKINKPILTKFKM